MHFQCTYTPHLQKLQSEAHLESSQTFAVEFFGGISQRVKAVDYFRRKAPSWTFDRILNATLPNNLLYFEEGLRRSFPLLELHKGILDSPRTYLLGR